MTDGPETAVRQAVLHGSFSEQYAYLAYDSDGAQDIAHLKGSMPLHLNGLAAALGATR